MKPSTEYMACNDTLPPASDIFVGELLSSQLCGQEPESKKNSEMMMERDNIYYPLTKKSAVSNLESLIGLDGFSVSVNDIEKIARKQCQVYIPERTKEMIVTSRSQFEKIVDKNIPIYGVTTGYGEMVYLLVENEKETELQTNLVRSHCAAVGPAFSETECRAILTARINALAKGYSAVRLELINRLIEYLQRGIIPYIPQVGSLGASGDLGPLSHIAITVIGEGYVYYKGVKTPTLKALKQENIKPMHLKFKEGLSLINGTSAMTGFGSLVVYDSQVQLKQAEIITALVLESQKASKSPFLAQGHDLARPHQGQITCAKNIRELTRGSKLMVEHHELRNDAAHQKTNGNQTHSTNVYLQKAYTLRCVPQFLGSVHDSLNHARATLEIEINSSNDNPLFFEGEEIFHGGNFHGQPIATVMDLTAIALTQIGIMSERRLNRLLNRYLNNDLPEFLVKSNPGLNCGFAGTQYPATALVAENRTICSPASIQSIPSNGDNQDVVSMGLIAARNARRILDNNHYILAIELMAGCQAVDLAGFNNLLSPIGKITYNTLRSIVGTLDEDRFMSDDIERVADFLKNGKLLEVIEQNQMKLSI